MHALGAFTTARDMLVCKFLKAGAAGGLEFPQIHQDHRNFQLYVADDEYAGRSRHQI